MRILFAGTALLVAAAAPPTLRLLQRGHPHVEEGLSAYSRGDFETALKAFDAARAQMPGNATVEMDRGTALYRLGRMDEAKEAFRRASELDEGALQARDYYDLGTTLARMGDREGAISALRKALVRDPKDEQARHNLEVLLRRLPPPQPSRGDGGTDGGADGGQDAGPKDAGSPDGGPDGGGDAGPQDAGPDGGAFDAGADGGQDGGRGGMDGGRDAGSNGSSRADGGSDAGSDAGTESGSDTRHDAGVDGGSASGQERDAGRDAGQEESSTPQVDREEAERVLDAVRQNEKNLQLWRFQQKKRPRKPNEKDW